MVVYRIVGEFIIVGKTEQSIDREISNIEKQVKGLQMMGMTGIKSWKIINKELIE